LNHCKRYDQNDYLLTEPNECFNLLKNEVYHVNISVVSTEEDDISDIKVKNEVDSPIYNLSEFNYLLKLKQSRLLYSNVSSSHGHFGFDINDYNNVLGYKIGIKECKDKGILEKNPATYVMNGKVVVSKMFTIIIQH
jgi:hypothetical protein